MLRKSGTLATTVYGMYINQERITVEVKMHVYSNGSAVKCLEFLGSIKKLLVPKCMNCCDTLPIERENVQKEICTCFV